MLGIHQGTGIGVCQEKRKKKTENCGHKHETFLCLVTGHKNFSKKHTSKKMITFLRYLVYGCIVLYIIGWIRTVLKYILGPQVMHEGVVARCYRPLLEIYLIPIKEVLKKVDKVLKTRGMCIKAVEKYLWLLKYVPDYFVTHEQIKIWHDNDDYCNDDELIES